MIKKNTIYEFSYLLFSFITILLSFFPLNISITIVDEYEIQRGIGYNILTIILFTNILLSMILFIIITIEFFRKKVIRNAYKAMCTLLIIYIYILTIIMSNKYIELTSDYRTKVGVYPEINTSFLDSTITLNELEQLQSENKSAIIYFERSDCPECIAITPDLLEYLDNYGVNYYLYNTLDDRNDNYERLTEILSLYSVESVPSLIELNNGKIEGIYEQRDLSLLLYPED